MYQGKFVEYALRCLEVKGKGKQNTLELNILL